MKKTIPIFLIFIFSLSGVCLAVHEGNHSLKNASSDIKEELPQPRFIYPNSDQSLSGEIEIIMEIEGANMVEFYLRRPESLTPMYLGRAEQKSEERWEYLWNTAQTPNGSYKLFAKILSDYGEYESQEIKIVVENEISSPEEKETIRKELEATKEQMKQIEQEVKESTELFGEEVVTEIEKTIKETQEVLPQVEVVEPVLEKEKQEVEKEVKEKALKMVETIEKEKQLENTLQKKSQTKEEIEQKIQQVQEELEKINRAKTLIEEDKKPLLEEVEKEKKEVLESHLEKKEEVETEITRLHKELTNTRKERENVEKEIIEVATEPVDTIKNFISNPEILKEVKKEIQEKIQDKLQELKKETSEKTKEKVIFAETLYKDSDYDGLSDYQEIELNTDPFLPDTDGDGFLDGVEVASGYNPLNPSPAKKIAYQDPRKVKPQMTDILKVERVELVSVPQEENTLIKLEGTGLPNTFVTIYIYSEPIVIVTKTDENGNWVYVLDKPLSPGEHKVYVALTNNQGKIIARSESFSFAKTSGGVLQIIPEVWAGGSDKTASEISAPYDVLKRSFIVLTMGIITLAVGIALLLIGLLTRRKNFQDQDQL